MKSKYHRSYVNPTFAVGAVSSAIIALVASVLYGIAYYTCYDKSLRHYEVGAPLPTVCGVLMLMSVIVFTVMSLILRKKTEFRSSAGNSFETFSLVFAAIIFFVFGIFSLTTGEVGHFASKLGEFCTKATAPLAMISSVYFFSASSESMRNNILFKIASFVPVLWGLSLLFKYYFALEDMPLNDPELTLTMVSVSAALVFFLSECRSALGINSVSGAVFSASAALCLTGSVSAARLVLWRLDGLATPSPVESVMLFAVAVVAGARLYSMRNSIISSPVEIIEDENTNEKENEPDENND